MNLVFEFWKIAKVSLFVLYMSSLVSPFWSYQKQTYTIYKRNQKSSYALLVLFYFLLFFGCASMSLLVTLHCISNFPRYTHIQQTDIHIYFFFLIVRTELKSCSMSQKYMYKLYIGKGTYNKYLIREMKS